MKKRLIAGLSVLTLSLSPIFTSTSSADILDDQVYDLAIPEKAAGYLGAYVDDSVSHKFSSYFIANDDAGIKGGIGYPCEDVSSESCSKYPRFTYNIYLPPCDAKITNNCITAVTAIYSDGKEIAGTLVSNKPDFTAPAFKGDLSIGIPDGWYPTSWKFAGVTHQGGSEFLLRASLFSFQNQRSLGATPQLRVAITPSTYLPNPDSGSWSKELLTTDKVTGLMSAGGAEGATCKTFLLVKECVQPWRFPEDIRYRVELKTSTKVSGWVNGRLSDPIINAFGDASGTQSYSIEAAPMDVPVFGIWKKYTDYSKEFQSFIQIKGGGAGRIIYPDNWREVYSGFGVEPFDKISSYHSLNTYDSSAFKEFTYFLAASDDKSIATKSMWQFESNRLFFQEGDLNLNECSQNKSGISGIVSTNSTMFLATPPRFNSESQSLDYQVAAPHFDRNGKTNIGRYNLVIDAEVARCLYKFSKAPIQASVTILNDSGNSQVATSVVSEKNGWLYLSVNGYTYSSPTLKVKLTQEAVPSPNATTGALPPIVIDPIKTRVIKVEMGKKIVFKVANPSTWKAKISNLKIVRFIPGGKKSTFLANPGLETAGKGTATVTLTDGKKSYILKVTVS